MNSRNKGKRGERQWRDELRANGYHARRGQQFAGGSDSPDVICDELAWIHFEVKAVERLNIEDAMEQARRDCGARSEVGGQRTEAKTPVVAHKRSHRPWLVTIEAETFFQLLRGELPVAAPRANGAGAESSGETPELTRETRVLQENLGESPTGTGETPVSQPTDNTENKEQYHENQN